MSATVTLRSGIEIGQQRAMAEARTGGEFGPYMGERARYVLEVLDWVQEMPGAVAPWALRDPAEGDATRRPDDPRTLGLERSRAESDEQLARVTGGASRRPGVHGHALAWVLCDPATEAPIW